MDDEMRLLVERLRESGWAVAVHNDYRLDGVPHTFWLWTRDDGRFVKGEGPTDEIALAQCVAAIEALSTPAVDKPTSEVERAWALLETALQHPPTMFYTRPYELANATRTILAAIRPPATSAGVREAAPDAGGEMRS